MVEHIASAMAPMYITCPLCGAKPFQHCRTYDDRMMRYTHAERNR